MIIALHIVEPCFKLSKIDETLVSKKGITLDKYCVLLAYIQAGSCFESFIVVTLEIKYK